MPKDDENKTLGFAFIEYSTPQASLNFAPQVKDSALPSMQCRLKFTIADCRLPLIPSGFDTQEQASTDNRQKIFKAHCLL